jgi:hypothetical protein
MNASIGAQKNCPLFSVTYKPLTKGVSHKSFAFCHLQTPRQIAGVGGYGGNRKSKPSLEDSAARGRQTNRDRLSIVEDIVASLHPYFVASSLLFPKISTIDS